MKRKKIISNFMFLAAMMSVSSVTGALLPVDVQASSSSTNVTLEYGDARVDLANQPEFPYWFPNQLLEWSAENDENLRLNKSQVELKDRVENSKLETVNSTQNKDTNIMAISIMNASTSGNSPNGENEFNSHTFSHWQYVDMLVYWGGSASEGIIVPPTPDVIDIAHKNGVKVTGTIFFSPTYYGGQMEWLNQFLEKDENGSFPIVDKLIEVCEAYGFDGWFLNQETGGTEAEPLTVEHSNLIQELILEFKSKAPDLELIYYDSMTNEGKLSWQNALNDSNEMFMKTEDGEDVSDTMFLNFWWTNDRLAPQELLKNSALKAEEIGINPYDLYAGIDIQSRGYEENIKFNLFEKSNNSTYTSLGLYCPSWTYFSSSTPEEFYEKENTLWVNSAGDPSVDVSYSSDTDFRGMSTYVTERTTINSLPFTSNFNLGNGYDFFKDGKSISSVDWNNRSLGDVMPTYRYIIQNDGKNDLSASIDMTTAYYGGNSIKLEGAMERGVSSEILLYSTDLTISEKFDFSTVLKSDTSTNVSGVLKLSDGTTETIEGSSTIGKDFSKISFDTSSLVGKTIRSISLKFEVTKSVNENVINLGNITLSDEDETNKSVVSNVEVVNHAFDDDYVYAGITLTWNVDKESEYYEIYSLNEDGTKTLLGVSNKTALYIDNLKRGSSDTNTFEVVPVNKYMNSGNSAKTNFEWPENTLPRASMQADITMVAPNEDVTLTSTSSPNTTDVSWILKGSNTPNAKGDIVTVSYPDEGTYSVTITASNPKGDDTVTYQKQIVVTNRAKEGLSVLSGGANTKASSYVNENEAPKFAVDGDLSKKWCAIGEAPHDITIDLGSVEHISQVKIYNAETGGEGSDMNTRAYEIYVSTDGVEYTKVASDDNNKDGVIVSSFAPTRARFVKVSIIKPTQGSDSAARIYEIEVLGL